ncbi:hypothetical protein J1N35_040570 [Gossypium stocksii]|uniref:Uncharacterized protein n=1 Tax=Gossypium stocksii TaxID=47602 RepID=A0A9D3UE77_9ROSI|nr:hypothetical protein J1N35_040570 [Gossypium stocksii]
MEKEGDKQNLLIEICGKTRENSRSRDMLSGLEGQVTNLKESMGGVKEHLRDTLSWT